ncbi:MAG: tyrosine-type recombinase/integrase, partial [Planctomycetota bacterium]
MKTISVRVVQTQRDGTIFKWFDHSGTERQRTHIGKKSRRAIEQARQELEETVNAVGATMRWSKFVERFNGSFLEGMTKGGQGKPRTMVNRMTNYLNESGFGDIACSDINEDIILAIQEQERAAGLAQMTVRTNMGALWAVLNWGAENNLLPRLHRPRKRVRKKDRKQASKAKGRSLTMEEIERMIDAINRNATHDPSHKQKCMRTVRKDSESAEIAVRAIHVMRLTGGRLDDVHCLRWDPSHDDHYIESLNGRTPAILYTPEQKSGVEQSIPLTPMAVQYLQSIAADDGYVCRMTGRQGEHSTANRLGRIIANAGRAAGVVVKPNGGRFGKTKFASAHDLRRTFASSMLDHLTLRDAQKMMRHASLETLITFYSDTLDEELATNIRERFGGYLVDQ